MSSHEARTDANQCLPGVSMSFSSSRPKQVCRCTSQHFVLDSNGLRHQKILVAADGTQIAFPTFFFVTKVRNCEDEPHLE
ncbi:hypothetical protein T02_8426 [Trichinella nativa]|uniref:Uncharacterized protein n=1 Tax=Trichinella nativa TaxID=6335 RepID=A0A0V1KKA3_9BILA|nr:hypothetical protein T02_8426 [Trichinella nativa]